MKRACSGKGTGHKHTEPLLHPKICMNTGTAQRSPDLNSRRLNNLSMSKSLGGLNLLLYRLRGSILEQTLTVVGWPFSQTFPTTSQNHCSPAGAASVNDHNWMF